MYWPATICLALCWAVVRMHKRCWNCLSCDYLKLCYFRDHSILNVKENWVDFMCQYISEIFRYNQIRDISVPSTYLYFLVPQIKATLRWHLDKSSFSVASYYYRICMGFQCSDKRFIFLLSRYLWVTPPVTVVICRRYCSVLLPLLDTVKLWL